MNSLIDQIISSARASGVNQTTLAARAGIPKETLSRAKKRGSAGLDIVQALARAAGVNVGIVPATPPSRSAPAVAFRERHRLLAWSNPGASPTVLLRRALVAPEFSTLLDAALEFGVDAVIEEWESLKSSGDPEAKRAAPITDRILRNIRHGYQHAAA
jgi:hypothetical protein